jgi:hypothetical protein
MSELISITEPSKRKGRPKQNLTVEQMQAKKDKMKDRAKELKKIKAKNVKILEYPLLVKILKKRGRKAKEYTKDEILNKIDHTNKYQREYQKKKYISKKQEKPKTLNHCLAKKYKLKQDDKVNIV